MAGCDFSEKLESSSGYRAAINLSEKGKAVVPNVENSGDSYKETFTSSKSVSERMNSKLKETLTPVSTFLSVKTFIRKKSQGWRDLKWEERK